MFNHPDQLLWLPPGMLYRLKPQQPERSVRFQAKMFLTHLETPFV